MYEDIEATIRRVIGVPAALKIKEQYNDQRVAKQALLEKYVDTEHDPNFRAYVFIDILFRNDCISSRWPSLETTDRDIRNNFRALCTEVLTATANGWGYEQTFNPQVAGGAGKPMLIHSFSIFKSVRRDDVGWQPFYLAEGFGADMVLARPALRLLQSPLAIQNLLLSTGLISQAKYPSASPVGFVINAPLWNLFGMAPRDIQFPNDQAQTARVREQGIPTGANNRAFAEELEASTPTQLIANTLGAGGCDRYNEIVLLGTSTWFNTKLKPTGIFVKVAQKLDRLYLVDAMLDQDWMGQAEKLQMRFYPDNQLIDAIKVCSRAFDLPIVPVLDNAMVDLATDHDFAITFAGLTIRNDWKDG
ncbi:MAG: hypothetical protein WA777_03575 [Rhodanobacter sp.]